MPPQPSNQPQPPQLHPTQPPSPPAVVNPGRNRLPVLLVLLLLLAGLFLVQHNRQGFVDWYRLRHYQAPQTVSQLASQDTMTDYARKVFYVNSPAIEDKATFNSKCPDNGGEQTIVLGCYHGGQNGIFLLNVTDSRLDGVEQVTAAHETLHAIYDRMSASERSRVNAMLTDYYDHQLHDDRIRKTIEAYKQSEPHDVINEMHSVFGTEISDLPANLEQHYAQYFTNRKQIAQFAAQYQTEFTSRQAVVAQDDARLTGIKAQINNYQADLKTKQAEIAARRSALFGYRDSGNVDAYNAGVPDFNRLIDSYNAEVATVQSLIAQYNQLVAARNAVALEVDQLANDLNSKIAPINK